MLARPIGGPQSSGDFKQGLFVGFARPIGSEREFQFAARADTGVPNVATGSEDFDTA